MNRLRILENNDGQYCFLPEKFFGYIEDLEIKNYCNCYTKRIWGSYIADNALVSEAWIEKEIKKYLRREIKILKLDVLRSTFSSSDGFVKYVFRGEFCEK